MPVLRAMILHYPEDKTCRQIDDQYFFGENMLVVPVMNSENKRDIYLPKGTWVHFFTRKIFEGERWLKNVEVPMAEIPVFVKQGATIPMYLEQVNCTDEMDMSKVIEIKY